MFASCDIKIPIPKETVPAIHDSGSLAAERETLGGRSPDTPIYALEGVVFSASIRRTGHTDDV